MPKILLGAVKAAVFAIGLAAGFATTPAPAETSATSTACPQIFAGGRPPVVLTETRKIKAQELCYSGYAVLHSGVSRGPVWSAERLTAAAVRGAWSMQREDGFHADRNLPFLERAELADYRGSGFDRGHLAPNADFATAAAAAESFSLANIVPQDPASNRYLWADIERAARDLALRYGEIYIVTGPIYHGDQIGWIGLGRRVAVPTHLYKAVYIPSIGMGGAWIAANGPGKVWRGVSLQEMSDIAKIDLFPAARDVKAMQMPAPIGRRGS